MISAAEAREFQLTRLPADFLEDPYPWYAALRQHDPVHPLDGGGVFPSRYEDAVAICAVEHPPRVSNPICCKPCACACAVPATDSPRFLGSGVAR